MLIYVCSPLKGDIEKNIRIAKEHCRRIALNGDIPLAPHVYFTTFLDDTILEERELGMKMGMKLLEISDELWVFGKPSEGMKQEIKWFKDNTNKPIRRF